MGGILQIFNNIAATTSVMVEWERGDRAPPLENIGADPLQNKPSKYSNITVSTLIEQSFVKVLIIKHPQLLCAYAASSWNSLAK